MNVSWKRPRYAIGRRLAFVALAGVGWFFSWVAVVDAVIKSNAFEWLLVVLAGGVFLLGTVPLRTGRPSRAVRRGWRALATGWLVTLFVAGLAVEADGSGAAGSFGAPFVMLAFFSILWMPPLLLLVAAMAKPVPEPEESPFSVAPARRSA